ncbi:hypothetical protein FRC02_011200 [Tulasnella sp. 418]|nr:hypothetical protein FRC02_011200 [Tulasnella sp. 418]
MGYRLVVITARSHEHSEITFAPSYVAKGKVNRWAGRTKAEVISALGAVLLIDDSLENALTCAKAGIPVLLFGTYQWNRRASTTTSPMDHLSHAERITAGDDLYWERDVVKELPSCIQRVAGWEEVLEWLHREGHRVCRQEAAIENEHEMSEAVAVVE